MSAEYSKLKLIISFSSIIINGSSGFFIEHEKLYFQIRFTENFSSDKDIVLKNYSIDLTERLNSSENYYKNSYLDFTPLYDTFITEIDLSNMDIDINKNYYLAILVKDEKDRRKNNGWTAQSAVPIGFKISQVNHSDIFTK